MQAASYKLVEGILAGYPIFLGCSEVIGISIALVSRIMSKLTIPKGV